MPQWTHIRRCTGVVPSRWHAPQKGSGGTAGSGADSRWGANPAGPGDPLAAAPPAGSASSSDASSMDSSTSSRSSTSTEDFVGIFASAPKLQDLGALGIQHRQPQLRVALAGSGGPADGRPSRSHAASPRSWVRRFSIATTSGGSVSVRSSCRRCTPAAVASCMSEAWLGRPRAGPGPRTRSSRTRAGSVKPCSVRVPPTTTRAARIEHRPVLQLRRQDQHGGEGHHAAHARPGDDRGNCQGGAGSLRRTAGMSRGR